MPGSCVVSFADKVGTYQKKMLRLEQSLKGNFDGDFLGFTSFDQIGSPSHEEIPYAFKAFAIRKAAQMGYETIIWADSAVYAKSSLSRFVDHVNRQGYAFFDNIGYSLGDYTNDRTLAHFNIERKESWNIKMIMACCMGFAASQHSVGLWLSQYLALIDFYKGCWDNDDLKESKDMRVKGHRHDQSVMSAIIYEHGLNILKGQDTFFAYEEHRKVMPIADTVCLFSAG